ncbi:hypothetical protein P7C70_g8335, partial [Phenoliferia sp. Uapishka_3]
MFRDQISWNPFQRRQSVDGELRELSLKQYRRTSIPALRSNKISATGPTFSTLPLELKEHIVLLIYIQDIARKSRLQAKKADLDQQERLLHLYDHPIPAPLPPDTGPTSPTTPQVVAIPSFPCLAALRLVNKELAHIGASHLFSRIPRPQSSTESSFLTYFKEHIGPTYAKHLCHIRLGDGYSDTSQIVSHFDQCRKLTSLDIVHPCSLDHIYRPTDIDTATRLHSSRGPRTEFRLLPIKLDEVLGDIGSNIKTLQLDEPGDFRGGRVWGPGDILKVVKFFPHLRTLKLHGDSLAIDNESPRQLHQELIEALGALPKLRSLNIVGAEFGDKRSLSYAEHWHLIEHLADKLEVLELTYTRIDKIPTGENRLPPTPPIHYPYLRELVLDCRIGHPSSSILSLLKGSPVTKVTCTLRDSSDLDSLLETFPEMQHLIVQCGRRHTHALDFHEMAAICLEEAITLEIRCPEHPCLRITDYRCELLDMPLGYQAAREAAQEALASAAEKRSLAFRSVLLEQAKLDWGSIERSEVEKLSEDALEELWLAWLD